MKYTNIFMILSLISASFVFCDGRQAPSADFLTTLTHCNYAPYCIKYLREKYPQDIAKINEIVEQHYFHEYRIAIDPLTSKKEKVRLLTGIQEHLIKELYWIDYGLEPIIVNTNDGTDRGVKGLRHKVLLEVMREVDTKKSK